MAIPTLLYWNETSTLKKSDETVILSSEIKFLRSVKRRSKIDKLRNEDIGRNWKLFEF